MRIIKLDNEKTRKTLGIAIQEKMREALQLFVNVSTASADSVAE